jgi:hypothetical protein
MALLMDWVSDERVIPKILGSGVAISGLWNASRHSLDGACVTLALRWGARLEQGY